MSLRRLIVWIITLLALGVGGAGGFSDATQLSIAIISVALIAGYTFRPAGEK